MKLRRNWAVEELVEHFKQCRSDILNFARRPPILEQEEPVRPKKRRKIEPSIAATTTTARRSTRSQSRRNAASASQVSQEITSTQEEVADSDEEGSVYLDGPLHMHGQSQSISTNPEPNDGLVACPICSRRMKETSINVHLDRCTQGLPTSPTPPPPTYPTTNGTSRASSIAYTQRTKAPPTAAQKDRLPTINYSMYTEASLRKKLKELGIPFQGTKELMRKRHTEWMNLWNANCDSSRPKSKRELLKELDTWERTLGRQLERGVNSASTGVMVKDFDREGWVKNHNDEFSDLIRKAREKRKAVTQSSEEEKKEDGSANMNHDVAMVETHETPSADIEVDDRQQDSRDISDIHNSISDATKQTNGNVHHNQETVMNTSEDDKSIANITSNGTNIHPPTITSNGSEPQSYTPQKLKDTTTQAAIDLTSSPAIRTGSPDSIQQAQTETPGKKRSRFFV